MKIDQIPLHHLSQRIFHQMNGSGGKEVEPNLEEAYVYFMHEDDPDV
ncbi:hypothetical protein C5S42_09680 [Candidatus Methanomarinus sp.]|jgi:hypothetical protein|nr:hypothetical protein C5S42_09680 [ANME-2 cluster archaeon]